MIRFNTSLVALALVGIVALGSGCAAESEEPEEQGSTQQKQSWEDYQREVNEQRERAEQQSQYQKERQNLLESIVDKWK